MATFQEQGLQPEILSAVEELGFENPTPIQEKALPVILHSQGDLIALAQTGTGKTAAFGLPVISLIEPEIKEVQSLVLCPTRELCNQIARDLESFSKYMSGVKVLPVYGGASIENQIRALKRGCNIIVGTPGRTLDLIRRKVLRVETIKWLVLDEADEMLNMGFKEELDAILENTPDEKRTFLFSATMPDEIASIASSYMFEPEEISVGAKNMGASSVSHEVYVVYSKHRYLALKRVVDVNPDIYGIIFCRTRRETQEVADKLIRDGYNAESLHGGLSQSQRDHVMQKFKRRNLQLLVATDVAARGLDVNDLSHVINYNLPDDPEVYTHRSGRTGRAGKQGISLCITNTKEVKRVKEIEKVSQITFERKEVPGPDEILEKKLLTYIRKIIATEPETKKVDKHLPMLMTELEELTKEDLVKKVLAMEFSRLLEYYRKTQDLNVTSGRDKKERGERGERKDRRKHDRDSGKYTTLQMNVGSKRGMSPSRLIGTINEKTDSREIKFGRIKVLKQQTYFEVLVGQENVVRKAFENEQIGGVRIVVQDGEFRFSPSPKKRNDRRPASRGRSKKGRRGRR